VPSDCGLSLEVFRVADRSNIGDIATKWATDGSVGWKQVTWMSDSFERANRYRPMFWSRDLGQEAEVGGFHTYNEPALSSCEFDDETGLSSGSERGYRVPLRSLSCRNQRP
jgi:hypothetical protein